MKTKTNPKKVTKRTKSRKAGPTPLAYSQDAEPASYLTHWKTREGEILAIREMQFDHLLNARALLRRKIAKLSEVEEALSREVSRRKMGEYKKFTRTPAEFLTMLAKFEKLQTHDVPQLFADWDNYGGNSE